MKQRFFRVGTVALILFLMLAYAIWSEGNKNRVTKMKTDEIASITETSEFVITNARVEFVKNPIGIDILNPSFSWEIESDAAGMKQKAYRIEVSQLEGYSDVGEATKERNGIEEGEDSEESIVVANSNENSKTDNVSKKLVWDSGYMESDKTKNIVYEGETLKSHKKYIYTITCINEDMEYAVSESGTFQTAYVGEKPFENAKMISMQGEENVYDEGQAVFVKEFQLQDKPLKKATFYGTALGIYDAYINGERVGNDELKPGWSNYYKSLYYNTYDVTKLLTGNPKTDNDNLAYENMADAHTDAANTNRIAVMLGTGWWCGRVSFGTYDYHKPGFICTIRLEYEDGSIQEINTDESWRYVKDTAVVSADIFNGEVYNANKPSTQELSVSSKQPEIATDQVDIKQPEIQNDKTNKQPEEGLRQEQLSAKEVVINTDFNGEYRSFYGYQVENVDTYDQNPMQAVIYDSVIDNGSKKGEIAYGSGAPLVISYEEDIVEKKDSKQEFEQILNQNIKQDVKQDIGQDVKRELKLNKGETVIFDFGQNMTGVPYINLQAEQGTEIKIDFAEMLNDSGKTKRGNDGPKGSLYTANYRSAVSDFTIIANGEQNQEYQPVFTYYGFRYMSVTANKDIIINQIKAKFIGNSSKETGWLVTDNELINQLYQNAKWTQRNNFLLVATDCPQRDERLGWTGDLQVFAKTSLYNQDLYSFYKKWCQDVVDSQTEEGAYTDTVPATITTGSGNAGWGDAGISVPLDVYRIYGNKELLQSSYKSMQKYMTYLESVSNFDVESGRVGPLTVYGDWLGFEDSDKELISTLYYGKDAMQMAQIAEILDDKKACKEYQKLHDKIRRYFHEKYMSDDRIKEEYTTQTVLVLALEYGFLSEEQAKYAVETLKEKIKDADMTLTTGFLGTPVILKALSDNQELAMAYELLTQEKNPSWLYSVKQGATTIWERYNSYTEEEGFADVGMNSFNHFNNGSVLAWMYEDMLGIKVDLSRQCQNNSNSKDVTKISSHMNGDKMQAGKEQDVVLKPGIILDYDKAVIRQVSGAYQSVYGEIAASWQISKQKVTYQVTIPANCQANLYLPVYDDKTKTKQISQGFELAAGNYSFAYDEEQNVWVEQEMSTGMVIS